MAVIFLSSWSLAFHGLSHPCSPGATAGLQFLRQFDVSVRPSEPREFSGLAGSIVGSQTPVDGFSRSFWLSQVSLLASALLSRSHMPCAFVLTDLSAFVSVMPLVDLSKV